MKKNLFFTLLLLFPLLSHALATPENILHGTCLKSYFQKYLPLQGYKAFAYARNVKTSQDSCGWYAGNLSIQIAEQEALQECRKKYVNASCLIVDSNGIFVANEEDFISTTPPNLTPISKKWKKILYAQAQKVLQGNCLPFFEQYLQDREHKAFAYSLDREGRYACGKGIKGDSIKSAKENAISACERDKIKRDTSMPHSTCRIYAENRQILLHPKDFAFQRTQTISSTRSNNPLFVTAQKSKEKKFFQYVKKGADIYQKSSDGSSLLFSAVEGGSSKIVRYLLRKGLDINEQNNNGDTALHRAFQHSKTYIIGILMQEGANPNIQNKQNQIPYETKKR
jgi:hypothetical protein